MENKLVLIEGSTKREWVVMRQIPGVDKPLHVGASVRHGRGTYRVAEVRVRCGYCGDSRVDNGAACPCKG